MDHPTFADKAFIAVLDKRLNERFPNAGDAVGEEVPDLIADCFRAWWGDPLTRATHHPVELRELAELMAIQWGVTVPLNASGFTEAFAQSLTTSGGAAGVSANAGPANGPSSALSRRNASKRH